MIQRRFRVKQRLVHQILNGRIVQIIRALQNDVTADFSAALQQSVRVPKPSSLQEKQAHPAREKGNRKDRFRGALRRAEADRQRVVIVINQLQRSRQALTQPGESFPGHSRHFRTEFGDEAL